MEGQTKMEGALEITQHPFERVLISHGGSLRKLTQVVDGKGNIGASEKEVVQRTNSTLIQGRIWERLGRGRGLGPMCERGGDRL